MTTWEEKMFKGKQEAESSKESNINEIECFMCPLSYDVMRDPVITPYGHTYERMVIETWLESNESDPFTRQHLNKEMLIPNFALKNAIEVWKKLDKAWQENANRYKEMEQRREQQERELFESQSKEKELVSQISELKIRDQQKGEELIAQKEQVNMFREKYLMTMMRLHAIGRKKTEDIKYSEHEFLESLNTYFPTEAVAIAALLDAQDSRLGKALEILDGLIFTNQGEALAATVICNSHVPSFDEIELAKQRSSKDQQVTTQDNDFVVAMLFANRGYIKENLGKLNVDANGYEQAIDDYKKAYLLVADEHWLSMVCNRWGWCLYRMQMFNKELSTDVRIAMLKDVVKFYDKSIEYDASYYKVFINKGRALVALAQLTKEDYYNDVALNTFSTVIEAAPNEVYTDAAYIGLGGIYLYRRDYKKAIEVYEKAVELVPIAFNYNELAKCYQKYAESLAKQDYNRELYFKQAIDNYEKSLKLYNEDENIHCHLGY